MAYSTAHIDYLAREYLSQAGKVEAVLAADSLYAPAPESIRSIHVRGVSRFWTSPPDPRDRQREEKYRMEDVLIGCHGTRAPGFYVIQGAPSSIAVHMGIFGPTADPGKRWDADSAARILEELLNGRYPGAEMQRDEEIDAPPGHLLEDAPCVGLLTGLPTCKAANEIESPTQIDLLVRSMYGSSWGLLVIAQPMEESGAAALYNAVLNEMRQVEDAERTKVRRSPLAEAYIETLKLLLGEYAQGRATGLWSAAAYYSAQDLPTLHRLGATLRACFGGEESRPEPVRTLEFPALEGVLRSFALPLAEPDPPPGRFAYPYRYLTLLHSGRLASLIHLPRVEMPGYTVRDSARFDVAAHQEAAPGVSLGEVTDRGRPMGNDYSVAPSALNKHALIVGATGSGKTNTCFHLLKQLWRSGVPFLVIEPAKTEYRSLLLDAEIGPDLRVFTLGDEGVSPLRLNPFETTAGVPVFTHIDVVKSVFNVSFAMWTPLPQVLERCIHEIYRDKGWDTVRGTNRRLGERTDERAAVSAAFPTLTDLYEKVEEIVDGLGYEERVTSDIKAALMTRLNSLRIGGKGVMLDCPRSIPVEELLARPTVLELERIGDDDEKAFLMGLVFIKIYEHLRSGGSVEGPGLRHVTVIEEAHRLLTNVPIWSPQEESNVRGKAVETFANMLSEVRAYGEGFLIAEQIPTKLSPDVIKNSNLKAVHRIVAADDRLSLGQAMNMENDQCELLATLKVGEAAVFAEGDDRPLLVQVPYAKIEAPPQMQTASASDEVVATRMQAFRGDGQVVHLFVPFEACPDACREPYRYCEASKGLIARPDVQQRIAAFILSFIEGAESALAAYEPFADYIRARMEGPSATPEAICCLLLNGLRWCQAHFGRQYGWPYSVVEEMRRLLTPVLMSIVHEHADALPDWAARSIAEYQALYRMACQRVVDPFPACPAICPSGDCLYRHHNALWLEDARLKQSFIGALARAGAEPGWSDWRALDEVVQRVLPPGADQTSQRSVALCYGMQQIAYQKDFLEEAKVRATAKMIEEYDHRSGEGLEGGAGGAEARAARKEVK